MNAKQRRTERDHERETVIKGATEFPTSTTSPPTKDCTTALYGVLWTASNGKVCGNCWTSKRRAIGVRNKKQAEGTFYGTVTTYCAGFAF